MLPIFVARKSSEKRKNLHTKKIALLLHVFQVHFQEKLVRDFESKKGELLPISLAG